MINTKNINVKNYFKKLVTKKSILTYRCGGTQRAHVYATEHATLASMLEPRRYILLGSNIEAKVARLVAWTYALWAPPQRYVDFLVTSFLKQFLKFIFFVFISRYP